MTRIAFVGSGGVVGLHASALKGVEGAEIVAFVARDPARAEGAAACHGGRPYTDLYAMLDTEKPEAVWVCVPPAYGPSTHAALVDREIPFLAEKPIANDPGAVQSTAEKAKARGLVAAAGYNWRALDFLPRIRDQLAESPPAMVLGYWLAATPPPAWWRHRDESGGQTVEQTTHLFDLGRFLLGDARVLAAAASRPIRPAYPDATVDGASAALLEFESGPVGLFGSTCLLAGQHLIQLKLLSEGCAITIALGGRWPSLVWTAEFDHGHRRESIDNIANPFQVQAERFLDAVASRNPDRVLCTYEDALKTLRLTLAVEEASSTRASALA